jgi:FkbM family methyltransferase
MSLKGLFSKIFALFPNGKLKDKIRVYLYNQSGNKEFSISKKEGIWIASYPGYDIKFCNDIVPYHILLTNFLFTRQFPKEPVDILVDAGAYIGSFSLYAAKKYPNIKKVIALEPDPLTYATIMKNLRLNYLPDFEILPYGLWNKKDTLTFYSEQHLSSSVYDISGGKGAVQIEVDTLDKILKDVTGKRIFIKMNIEGAELEALHGCSETIKNNKVYFAISSDHIVEGQLTQKKVEDICRGIGLSVTTFKPNQFIIVYASNEVAYSDPITI